MLFLFFPVSFLEPELDRDKALASPIRAHPRLVAALPRRILRTVVLQRSWPFLATLWDFLMIGFAFAFTPASLNCLFPFLYFLRSSC